MLHRKQQALARANAVDNLLNTRQPFGQAIVPNAIPFAVNTARQPESTDPVRSTQFTFAQSQALAIDNLAATQEIAPPHAQMNKDQFAIAKARLELEHREKLSALKHGATPGAAETPLPSPKRLKVTTAPAQPKEKPTLDPELANLTDNELMEQFWKLDAKIDIVLKQVNTIKGQTQDIWDLAQEDDGDGHSDVELPDGGDVDVVSDEEEEEEQDPPLSKKRKRDN